MLRVGLMFVSCCCLVACNISSKSEILRYQCESGEIAQVTYEQEKAILQYQGETHVLEQAISASGARYRNARVEWWSKESEATLFTDDQGSAGDILDRCRQDS